MSVAAHALATALASAPPHPWPHGDPDRVVKAILAQRAYAKAPATSSAAPAPGLWEIVRDWLGSKLGPIFGPLARRLFGGIARALQTGGNVGSALGIALIVASLLGLLYAIVRLTIAFVRPAATRSRGYGGLALGERGTPAQWRAVARDAAARGEYRLAIAALFAAAVAALDERQIVRFDPARTAGEYRRVVRRSAASAAPPFDELTEHFVRASYAEVAANGDDFGTALGALDRFEPALHGALPATVAT